MGYGQLPATGGCQARRWWRGDVLA